MPVNPERIAVISLAPGRNVQVYEFNGEKEVEGTSGGAIPAFADPPITETALSEMVPQLFFAWIKKSRIGTSTFQYAVATFPYHYWFALISPDWYEKERSGTFKHSNGNDIPTLWILRRAKSGYVLDAYMIKLEDVLCISDEEMQLNELRFLVLRLTGINESIEGLRILLTQVKEGEIPRILASG